MSKTKKVLIAFVTVPLNYFSISFYLYKTRNKTKVNVAVMATGIDPAQKNVIVYKSIDLL